MNYIGFHLYLVELVGSYNRTKSLRGVSLLAKKHKCACVTKEQFFEFGLHLVSTVSRSLSDDIRDRLAKLESRCRRRKNEEGKEEGNHMLVDWDALGKKYGLVELTPIDGSPFKYALDNGGLAIDDIGDGYHAEAVARDLSEESYSNTLSVLRKHIDKDLMHAGSDGIRFACRFVIPTLCYVESGDYFCDVVFVKANNNGSSFWFCTRKEPLLLLAHFDYVVKCLKSGKEIGN